MPELTTDPKPADPDPTDAKPAGPTNPSRPRRPAAAPVQGGVKLSLFVGGLVLALIAGFALGKVINPTSPTTGAQTGAPAGIPADPNAAAHVHTGPQSGAGTEPGGLSISNGGYTMVPAGTVFAKPGPQQLSFVINGADGKPVSTFAVIHEKPLHLVLVRRDLTGYQHLHPTMAPDGTWTVSVQLPRPGVWRAYGDFTAVTAAGVQTALALGTDLTVSGGYTPSAIPAAAREAGVDGYTVTYEGTPAVGSTQPMLFRVSRNGAPVTDLQPYLGSFGHLVVLRSLDLAYVHVHPEPALSGGAVKLWLAIPSSGTYRMYFDFQLGGKVRTAEFTLVAK